MVIVVGCRNLEVDIVGGLVELSLLAEVERASRLFPGRRFSQLITI